MLNFRILTTNDIPKLEHMKQKLHIFRVVETKIKDLEMVEFFSRDGVFRGFGKSTKIAYKKAKKAAVKYYKSK